MPHRNQSLDRTSVRNYCRSYPLMKMCDVSTTRSSKNCNNFEIPQPSFQEQQKNRIGASLGNRHDGLFCYLMLGTTTANL